MPLGGYLWRRGGWSGCCRLSSTIHYFSWPTKRGYVSHTAIPSKKIKQIVFVSCSKFSKMNLELTINGASSKKKSPSAISTLDRPKKLIAFGWYGGKYSHPDWLLPFLPECTHYCELFAGSGAVLLNREPSPATFLTTIEL